MMGLVILQQMFDLTDDGAVEQFCFNIQWHYALNITSSDDQHAYISAKTLWSMRDTLSTESLYHEIFTAALKTLEKLQTAHGFSPYSLQHAPPGTDWLIRPNHQEIPAEPQTPPPAGL
ncbi:MAG: transposase [Desulfofustis sp. PB-SRB1]|nr:transposase [Desulfofustis sp. PB-SRB1]